jgi:hypothetical protein
MATGSVLCFRAHTMKSEDARKKRVMKGGQGKNLKIYVVYFTI